MTQHRRHPTPGLRIISRALIVVACIATVSSAQENQQQAAKSNLVNLNDILVHQRALVAQCRQLEAQKLAQLKRLLRAQSNQRLPDLSQDRLTLQLPAVCLLLLGPPTLEGGVAGARDTAGDGRGLRLEFVNWIYDREQLLRATGSDDGNANRTKRQAEEPEVVNSMLSDYWLDLNKINSTGNEMEDDDQVHRQMDAMLANENFQEAIRHEASGRLAGYLSPVILVPGLAGSRLQARVTSDRRPRVNILCSRQTGEWQDVWLTLRWFLPLAIDCWLDNARLEFDPTSGFARQPAGIESRVPNFGSIESVRHLDLKSPKLTRYFHAIIERYTQLGYVPDRNLFAAPYDFRLAPQQIQSSFFDRLRELIDFAFASGGQTELSAMPVGQARVSGSAGKRVTLVCHSMGCTHLLIFLRSQSPAWRQMKIRKLIALSSPWAGSIKALKGLLVGEQFGLPIISDLKIRALVRTMPSIAYLLPQPEVFERPNKNQAEYNSQLLVQTPERAFRVNDLEALLREAGLEQQWLWYMETSRLIKPLEPLQDLQVDCLHSLNIPTPETIIFRNSSDFPDGNYEIIEGDGDGTVNHQSLLICGLWAAQLPGQVRHKIIPNTSHTGMLSHKQTLEHITDDVLMIDTNHAPTNSPPILATQLLNSP